MHSALLQDLSEVMYIKSMNPLLNDFREKGFLAEWFQPYGPADYAGIC